MGSFKIHGGNGRLHIQSLAELRSLGVYLFPGCKTPLVSRKKQIKITVSSKACFASIYCSFFMSCMQSIKKKKTRTTNNRTKCTFGSTHTELIPLWSTFEWPWSRWGEWRFKTPSCFLFEFLEGKNLHSWAACGAVPLTREPLNHCSVQHELEPMVKEEQLADTEGIQETVLLEYQSKHQDTAGPRDSEPCILQMVRWARLEWESVEDKCKCLTKNFTNVAPLKVHIKVMVVSGISLTSFFILLGQLVWVSMRYLPHLNIVSMKDFFITITRTRELESFKHFMCNMSLSLFLSTSASTTLSSYCWWNRAWTLLKVAVSENTTNVAGIWQQPAVGACNHTSWNMLWTRGRTECCLIRYFFEHASKIECCLK